MTLRPRRTFLASCVSRLVPLAMGAVLIVGPLACRTTPQGADTRASSSRCDMEAPGTLRIANSSGRLLDVYVARPAGSPQLLAQVSPGAMGISVPGPSDLGVRYDVIDPNARKLLASVNWNRRTGRETMAGVIVELVCTVTPGMLAPAATGGVS